MAGNGAVLADNPRDAIGRYIAELDQSYRPWYERASSFNKIMLIVGQGTAILAGATTAFVAALVDQAVLNEYRWLLVLLPLVGAFATALMAQTRVRDILTLRESGRREIQVLIDSGKASYASRSTSDDEISKLHRDLIVEVARLEERQAASILSMVVSPNTNAVQSEAGSKRSEQ
jgi:hypothetical protein